MNGKKEVALQLKPSLAKVIFMPFGIISLALWGFMAWGFLH
ncbi:hypothetical protein [Isobaculum melis]|nr:hypothetical protein [Isobaculum melis]